MPLRWTSCLFRPRRGSTASLEVNTTVCPNELQEQLALRGTACLRPRGAHILYERVDDAGQGAFTPPVVIYLKRLSFCGGLEVCVKRTLVTHFVSRAAREARLQVQLEHPHLLPALACVRGRHHYYLVLPAAETDLWAEAEALRQQGTGYSEEQLRGISRQILLGLEHLHASHLAHRDIKPANLLRMADGRAALADFGCAESCTAGFVAAGTTQYQPPECRRSSSAHLAVLPRGYDQRMQDMWGLGATLASLWFVMMPEVIRTTGCSRISSAVAAASAVAASTTSIQSGGRGGCGTNGSCLEERRSSSHGWSSSRVSEPSSGGVDICGDGGAGTGGVGVEVRTTAAAQPPPLPGFLVAAGFAGCRSTIGAFGNEMSEAFLDLLSKLLRLRPSERLTARQALQHEWLMPDGGGGGSGTGVVCQRASSSEQDIRLSNHQAPATNSLSPSPVTSPITHLNPFTSCPQQELRSMESSPVTPRHDPSRLVSDHHSRRSSMTVRVAASKAMETTVGTATDGSVTQQRHEAASPLSVEPCQRRCKGLSPYVAANQMSLGDVNSTISPSDAESPQSPDVPRRVYRTALSVSLPNSHICDSSSSPAVQSSSGSPVAEARNRVPRLQQRQQQRRQEVVHDLQQQQQQEHCSASSPPSSSWFSRPSSHQSLCNAAPGQGWKRSHPTILRVFVGAGGGESTGSN